MWIANPSLLGWTLALACPRPVITVNPEGTGSAWTAVDEDTFRHATVRCGELYPRSPCLVEFRKLDIRRYQAICGGKR